MKTRAAWLVLFFMGASTSGSATPSSTMWTPMTLDIQSYGVLHIGVDNYFTVFRKFDGGAGAFPTDAGLTLGILSSSKIQAEVGVDLLGPADYPWVFNAKIGAPEEALGRHAPALQVGVFGVGTKGDVTNQNVFYGVVGKSLLPFGRVSAGPYVGNGDVLRDAGGNEENSGFMVGYDRGFAPAKDGRGPEYSQVVFAADYASGENAIGGGGAGIYYFFRRNISVLTGPVWFNEEAINGKWKWSIQLDINHPRLFGK
jgi:hypothetical protein